MPLDAEWTLRAHLAQPGVCCCGSATISWTDGLLATPVNATPTADEFLPFLWQGCRILLIMLMQLPRCYLQRMASDVAETAADGQWQLPTLSCECPRDLPPKLCRATCKWHMQRPRIDPPNGRRAMKVKKNVSHLSPMDALSALVRIISSHQHDFRLVSHLSPSTLGCSEGFGPHDFTLVSNLSPSTLWMVTVLRLAWFDTCSHLSTLLPLLPPPSFVLHCLRYHHHQPPSTNHHLQPLPAQTSNTMKLDWSTNKLYNFLLGGQRWYNFSLLFFLRELIQLCPSSSCQAKAFCAKKTTASKLLKYLKYLERLRQQSDSPMFC